MFAFILYDKKEGKIIVARDRAGIKPVHFYSDDECIIIASEVKAILNLLKKYSARSQALHDILFVGHIEGPLTGFKNIFTLQPGHYMEIDLDSSHCAIKTYCDILQEIHPREYRENAVIPFDRAVEKLDTLIRNSVRMHLISDAPVGALCSGGIDSSLVTTIAHGFNPDITMYHAGTDEEGWGEEKYAEMVADHLDVDINYIKMNQKIYLGTMVDAIYQLELPMYQPSDISLNRLCARAHTNGVKVLLSGEGADELFGGYQWHKDFWNKLTRQKYLENRFIRMILSKLQHTRDLSTDPNFNFLRGILHTNTFSDYRFATKNYPLVLNHGDTLVRWDRIYRAFDFIDDSSERLVNTLMVHNIYGHLGSLLYRADRMGMMASIENRVPFLENNIIHYAFNLPLKYKISHNESKFILKKVAEKYLPKEVVYRKKRGFPVPWVNYIDYNENLFAQGFVEEFFSLPLDIIRNLTRNDKYLLFKLINIEIWGRLFVHQEPRESIKRIVG